jgi:hypothetical protein
MLLAVEGCFRCRWAGVKSRSDVFTMRMRDEIECGNKKNYLAASLVNPIKDLAL